MVAPRVEMSEGNKLTVFGACGDVFRCFQQSLDVVGCNRANFVAGVNLSTNLMNV